MESYGPKVYVDSEDSDQTGWSPWLIFVFTERTGHSVGFVTLQTYHFWDEWLGDQLFQNFVLQLIYVSLNFSPTEASSSPEIWPFYWQEVASSD